MMDQNAPGATTEADEYIAAIEGHQTEVDPPPAPAPYNPNKYPRPSVTVDLVIFTVYKRDLLALLVRRGVEPFKDTWALPGGFVRITEPIDETARRELAEETG